MPARGTSCFDCIPFGYVAPGRSLDEVCLPSLLRGDTLGRRRQWVSLLGGAPTVQGVLEVHWDVYHGRQNEKSIELMQARDDRKDWCHA